MLEGLIIRSCKSLGEVDEVIAHIRSHEELASQERRCRNCTSTKAPNAMIAHGPGKLPEKGKSPKVLRRGCKRSFGPSVQKASCTVAKWGCTGAKEVFGDAKDSWETFAHRVQNTFCTLPLPLLEIFPLPAISQVRGSPSLRHLQML